MGKVIERVKITNVFEPSKSIEIDALIDTGVTMVVLPQDIVSELGLMKVREATLGLLHHGGFRPNPYRLRMSTNRHMKRPLRGIEYDKYNHDKEEMCCLWEDR